MGVFGWGGNDVWNESHSYCSVGNFLSKIMGMEKVRTSSLPFPPPTKVFFSIVLVCSSILVTPSTYEYSTPFQIATISPPYIKQDPVTLSSLNLHQCWPHSIHLDLKASSHHLKPPSMKPVWLCPLSPSVPTDQNQYPSLKNLYICRFVSMQYYRFILF